MSGPDRRGLFAALLGALLGLSLLKFGNPVFLGYLVPVPGDFLEWVYSAWPLGIGQGLLLAVALLGVSVVRWPAEVPLWLRLAPLPWLLWQWVATAASTDVSASVTTTLHLTSIVACYYLGLLCLASRENLRAFWALLLAGYVLVLLSGWQQHFGGLQATREWFEASVPPETRAELPPELLQRMTSNRIFGTLFYPNTLAGAVLLLLPVCVGVMGRVFQDVRLRRIALALAMMLSAGCLVWSGSKAGWLLALILGFVALMRLPWSGKLKLLLAAAVVVAGLGGFVWRYSDYLERGATSAVARLDYWEAGARITASHPFTGSGPGTFGSQYQRIKRPESEMARAVHNDFFQQASDSGIPGFLAFTAFIVAGLIWTGRRVWGAEDRSLFWIWLGLLGISLQSLTEFGLYIPAISWVSMTLLGWLIGVAAQARQIQDSRPNLRPG